MAARIAEVEIDYVAPFTHPHTPKSTIDVALSDVDQLCSKVGHGKASYVELYRRFDLLYKKLAADEANGKVRNDLFDDYATAIEEFWRLLVAYDVMPFVERLLNLQDTRANLVRVNEQVEKLFDKAGLKSDLKDDWAELNHEDTRTEWLALEALATNASEVLYQVRGGREKQDAIVLLKAEMNKKDSKLPASSLAAVKAAYFTLAVMVDEVPQQTPLWFTMQSEITYKLKPFGQGSFGSVHRGTFRNHETVVVKFVRVSDDALEQAAKNALRANADQLFALRHDHIVSILGANHVCSVPFIVMEHAEHGTMIDYLARGNKNKMWQLFYEGAQGIEYLHSRRVVHGNLKLNNILISSDGKARAADFGLSQVERQYGAKSRSMRKLKNGAEVYGALRWRAPEHVAFEPQYASDVYSYAMCIIEAFTGEAPYGTDSDQEVKRKIVEHILPLRPKSTPDGAWALILKMTSLVPKQRPTMTEVLDTLKTFATSEHSKHAFCKQCLCTHAQLTNFCSNCGSTTNPPTSSTEEQLRTMYDDNSSDEARILSARSLYRKVRSEVVRLSSEHVQALVTVAKTSPNWKTSLYAFCCLPDGPVRDIEIRATKNGEHQISHLVNALRDATGPDVSLLHSAALSALAALVLGDFDREELQHAGISSVLRAAINHSPHLHDKVNAAVILGNVPEVAQEWTSVVDVDGVLFALKNGDSLLKVHLIRALGHIAKIVEGATMIVRRGGMILLLHLMTAQDSSDDQKQIASEVVVQLTKFPNHARMFAKLAVSLKPPSRPECGECGDCDGFRWRFCTLPFPIATRFDLTLEYNCLSWSVLALTTHVGC